MRQVKRGPISISYRHEKDMHYCTALEFDIVGTGETRQAALNEMLELLSEYFIAVLGDMKSGNKVEFFCPSDASEWPKEAEPCRQAFVTGDQVSAPPEWNPRDQ